MRIVNAGLIYYETGRDFRDTNTYLEFTTFGCFLGFSNDVTATTLVLSSACTSTSEVKTHSLRTSVSFLLHVTS